MQIIYREHFESNYSDYSDLGLWFRRCNLKVNFTEEVCQTKTDHNSSGEIKGMV